MSMSMVALDESFHVTPDVAGVLPRGIEERMGLDGETLPSLDFILGTDDTMLLVIMSSYGCVRLGMDLGYRYQIPELF